MKSEFECVGWTIYKSNIPGKEISWSPVWDNDEKGVGLMIFHDKWTSIIPPSQLNKAIDMCRVDHELRMKEYEKWERKHEQEIARSLENANTQEDRPVV